MQRPCGVQASSQPVARVQLRVPDAPGLDLDANDLDRILGRPPAEADLQPEAGEGDAADVYEDGSVLAAAEELARAQLGAEGAPEPASQPSPAADTGSDDAPVTQPAVAEAATAEAGTGQSKEQETRPWAIASEPLDEVAAMGPDADVVQEWGLDELEVQGDAALPLACYAAVPQWEDDVLWGSPRSVDSASDASGVAEQGGAAAVNALTHDANGVPWDTESSDGDGQEAPQPAAATEAGAKRSATQPAGALSRRPSSLAAAVKAKAQAAGIVRDWDNSQPMDPSANAAPRSARKQRKATEAADAAAGVGDGADDWEAELQVASDGGPLDEAPQPQTSGESAETQDAAVPLTGLRVHDGVPRRAVYLDSGACPAAEAKCAVRVSSPLFRRLAKRVRILRPSKGWRFTLMEAARSTLFAAMVSTELPCLVQVCGRLGPTQQALWRTTAAPWRAMMPQPMRQQELRPPVRPQRPRPRQPSLRRLLMWLLPTLAGSRHMQDRVPKRRPVMLPRRRRVRRHQRLIRRAHKPMRTLLTRATTTRRVPHGPPVPKRCACLQRLGDTKRNCVCMLL